MSGRPRPYRTRSFTIIPPSPSPDHAFYRFPAACLLVRIAARSLVRRDPNSAVRVHCGRLLFADHLDCCSFDNWAEAEGRRFVVSFLPSVETGKHDVYRPLPKRRVGTSSSHAISWCAIVKMKISLPYLHLAGTNLVKMIVAILSATTYITHSYHSHSHDYNAPCKNEDFVTLKISTRSATRPRSGRAGPS